jgi:hypothetical protein
LGSKEECVMGKAAGLPSKAEGRDMDVMRSLCFQRP